MVPLVRVEVKALRTATAFAVSRVPFTVARRLVCGFPSIPGGRYDLVEPFRLVLVDECNFSTECAGGPTSRGDDCRRKKPCDSGGPHWWDGMPPR
jgi:hypothetical protein